VKKKTAFVFGLAGSLTTPIVIADETRNNDEQLWQVIEEQQARIESLEESMKASDSSQADDNASVRSGARDFHIGGYGSIRAETNNLDADQDTFTFRRIVLTGDGKINDRLEAYFELEFERFGEIELEKSASAGADGFSAGQAIEGTNGSEISMEQAWARYRVNDSVNLDMGALLVPLGRFNINHDDNQWNLTRRTLVDRGAPVLPTKAAWPELGLGFSGLVETQAGLVDYRLYAVNGVNLDFAFEGEVAAEPNGSSTVGVSKFEAEFAPSRGGFSNDLNGNKAITGRLALLPQSGQELAISGYYGRYTPDFMDSESVWSVALDGLHSLGGFEIEYEVVHTDWGNIDDVAASFASAAIDKEVEAKVGAEGGETTEIVSEITLGGLAESRTGYWIEARYPFWPEALDNTFLGRGFSNPSLEPTVRMEQVVIRNRVTGIEFSNRQVTELDKEESSIVNRATVGLAYRPVPDWVISFATEYTWTDEQTLAGLTNFIPAGENENSVLAFSTGVAYAF
tara:strand:- start:8763 stop:10301 length:1539 start_codon:yes stop_codon:yes gene_type:complete